MSISTPASPRPEWTTALPPASRVTGCKIRFCRHWNQRQHHLDDDGIPHPNLTGWQIRQRRQSQPSPPLNWGRLFICAATARTAIDSPSVLYRCAGKLRRRTRRRGRSRILMSVRTATRNFDLLLAIAHPPITCPSFESRLERNSRIPVVHGGHSARLFCASRPHRALKGRRPREFYRERQAYKCEKWRRRMLPVKGLRGEPAFHKG
jgi:hypothetical protein